MQNKICNKGVTLVEIMIALVILLIVFLGLMQTALLSIQSNMINVLRDEAVSMTSAQMAILRSASYEDMDQDGGIDASPLNFNRNQNRDIRNVVNHPFTVAINIQTLDTEHKQITVTTTWSWQGQNYQHQIMSIRRR
ncbi:MAG: prepilin-type N-terminal cleavage/methylation domain-containing protein [Nitrospirota bacterium]